MTLIPIDNTPMPYDWGSSGGISRLLGRPPRTEGPEAELWLGSHSRAPSVVLDPELPWADLREWEEQTGHRLPFLLKILDAAAPLSLQVHPSLEQARQGFEREDRAGVARDAPHRNYRDPQAKPEMIVAVQDGFEALCGFREPSQVRALLQRVRRILSRSGGARQEDSRSLAAVDAWEQALVREGPKGALSWLLSGASDDVVVLLRALEAAAPSLPDQMGLVPRLLADYPRDPGVAVALMMNHVTLRAGEGLFLPAGNIHAYLRGVGVEVMGPSDNVLRGGLTHKHVDTGELLEVLDGTPGPARRLERTAEATGLIRHRVPADGSELARSSGEVPFEVWEVTGEGRVATAGPSIIAVLDGHFELDAASPDHAASPGRASSPSGTSWQSGASSPSRAASLSRESSLTGHQCAFDGGDFLLVTDSDGVSFRGSGRAFMATGAAS